MKKPINPKKRRAPITETKGSDFILKRAKTSNSWQDLFPNPEIHFQKDRAVRFMLFIHALIKDLFAPIVGKDVSSIILSYHLDLMSLNSLLKIISNRFESAFYPPSLIQKEDDAKQLEIPYMVNEIIRAMQFLQVKSVIEETCNPWTLLNRVNDQWSTPSDIKNILTASKQFLKNISRVTTTEAFMLITEEFIKIVIKTVQTENNLLDKNLLQTNLITAMFKALKDLVIELNKESTLLALDLLSSNEDIPGSPVESSTSFDELIPSTNHIELKHFYQYLQSQELKLGDEPLIESYLSSLKFPIAQLNQLILLQCFKWPSVARLLYRKLSTHIILSGKIFATGLITPFLKEEIEFKYFRPDQDFKILATKVKKPAYESHYFIFLHYYLSTFYIPNNFKGYKEMLQFYFRIPGLVNNILFLMEAKPELLISHGLKPGSDVFFHNIVKQSWRNYPAKKLEYRLIPYLGPDILSTNLNWLFPQNSNFASMIKGLIEKIKYFMFYFSPSQKQEAALQLKSFLERIPNVLEKKNQNFLNKVVENELPKKLTTLIPQDNFFSSSSVSTKLGDLKLTLLNNLSNTMGTGHIADVIERLHQLYYQPGLQNIWLELMVPSSKSDKFDHPLLFLLRHADKAQLKEITSRCPGIWANLPDNQQLDKISLSSFPLSPLNTHLRVKAANFRKYLNPHGDTLLTYAIKKANPHAVSFILEGNHTLISQPDAKGNLPLKLASNGSEIMKNLLTQASKAQILNL